MQSVPRRSPFDVVFQFHECTKHHFHRMSPSLGYLDWSTQPNPFRFFQGCKTISLNLNAEDPDASIRKVLNDDNPASALTRDSLSKFLEFSMGLSAWKETGGSRWALRMNPSSGNLHPTEVHLLLPDIPEFSAGVYHYDVFHHQLEQRSQIVSPSPDWQPKGFFVLLTSIYWREAWKYGERAFRYCQHDVGHAIAAIDYAAALLGWKIHDVPTQKSSSLECLFGFDRVEWVESEKEEADLLLFISPTSPTEEELLALPLDSTRCGELEGSPNSLSPDHHPWPNIQLVSEATKNQGGQTKSASFSIDSGEKDTWPEASLAQTIRKRRSAVAFDGKTRMSRETFFTILKSTLPGKNRTPLRVQFGNPAVHLLLFVHRVDNIPSGMYLWVRNANDLISLKKSLRTEFSWKSVHDHLPLFQLKEGDMRREATLLSCQQSIAGDSAFSLGMLARFQEEISSSPSRYRSLFWETGMIGQTLYLMAEAFGVRGTGIGCFFDDAVHELIGLKDQTFQSLYHFTVGGPLEDSRLRTYPPYAHLNL